MEGGGSAIIVLRVKNSAYQICVLKVGVSKKILKIEDEVKETDRDSLKVHLLQDLRRVGKELNIKRAILLIPFRHISTEFLEFPIRKRPDIARAIPFELEKRLPLPVDDYLHAFDILRYHKNSTRIISISIIKQEIDFYQSIFKEVGIHLEGVRINFIETVNELLESSKFPEGDFIFIREENGYHNLAAFKNYQPFIFRHFRNKDLLLKEIERLTEQEGLRIYYAGKDNTLSGQLEADSISVTEEHILLRSISKGRLDIVFIPAGTERTEKAFYTHIIVVLALLSVLLYISSLMIPYYLDYFKLRKLDGEINEIETGASDVITANKRLRDLRARLSDIQSIESHRVLPIHALRELSLRLPENSWVTKFNCDNTKIELSGFSERATGIVEPLESSELFKDVRFTSPIVSKKGKEIFKLKMVIEQ